ncbi:uncharacterized protein TNCV_2704571 [Trichonephila clavipes]|nr:uncharacterized protein TNCV_2704571 [Trichonephila clavipes]
MGSGECGQHPCPPERRRACRKGPVQHEFYVDVSGDSHVQWGQTKLGKCFTSRTHRKIFKITPPDFIGISLSVLSERERDHSTFFLNDTLGTDRIRSKTRVIRGYAKSLCDELEISFEPPRRIRRKHIFGDGSKDVQLSYEDDLRRTMFLQ